MARILLSVDDRRCPTSESPGMQRTARQGNYQVRPNVTPTFTSRTSNSVTRVTIRQNKENVAETRDIPVRKNLVFK